MTARERALLRSGVEGRRAGTTLDFARLLQQWDSIFQSTVDPTREDRIRAILAALGPRVNEPSRILDLGTGPGPLAARVLDRYGSCRVVGLDTDPVLLSVGQRALARYRGRATWLLADLRRRGWSSAFASQSVDAAVSSLALHWFEAAEIENIYRELHRLIRPGGLIVNGDFLPSDRAESGTSRKGIEGERKGQSRVVTARVQKFKPKWEKWWRKLEREPLLHDAFRERQARLPGPIPPKRTSGPSAAVRLEFHERALRHAGFREIAVEWRAREFRVLVAIR